jgi:hypothetical protein
MFDCKALEGLNDFTDVLRLTSDKYGHVILGESMARGDEVGRMKLDSENFSDLVESGYRKSRKRISKIHRPGDPVAQVSVNIRPAFISTSADFVSFDEDLFMTVIYTEYAQRAATFSMTFPYSRSNNTEQDMINVIEPLMQFYVSFSRDLTSIFDPTHSWISEIDEYIPKIVREPKVNSPVNIIFWSNFFSNENNTEEFFHSILNAPVGISRDENGGVWFQLHQNFLTVDRELTVEIINEVSDYFSRFGIEHVLWRKI